MRGLSISDTISNMGILRLIAIILFFVLVAVLSVHSINSINQDIGRHLKSGEIIWQTKSVYKTNLFSFTEPTHPFINHHWLSEVVFYLLNGIIGLKGLIIFKAAAIVAAFFLIFKSLPRAALGWPFLAAGIPAILVFSSRTDIRPEVFSYLFLSFFLFAIFRAKHSNEHKWLYALPVIQIFWTNMHIYFALGPALLFIFWLDRLAHDKIHAKKIFTLFAATVLTTLINPNFISGALAPLMILRDYGYSIVENQSIFFLTDYSIQLRDIYIFEVSLAILIPSFIVALKRGQRAIVFEFLTALAFTIMAGKMIRNFGPYALVFTSVIAVNLAGRPPTKPSSSTERLFQILLYGALIAVTLLLIRGAVNNKLHQWFGDSKKFGLILPIGAQGGVDFVKDNGLKGPIFNNFDVGSFLIWKLYPEEKVFVDGRPEAYSVDFFSKIYKPMQEDLASWQKYSEEYKINYIFFGHTDMTPWARTFLSYISQNPNWPLIYLDGSTAIFIKHTPANLKLIKKFEIKK